MLPKALDEKKTSNDVCDVVVLTARIELAWLSPLPPQDSVSTNSTTSAQGLAGLAAVVKYITIAQLNMPWGILGAFRKNMILLFA